MRITQGAFSFLPDLTDEQIARQAQYCIDKGWAVSLEFTDDPHPRNTYWEMWGHPMFDNPDAAALIMELKECRKVYGDGYIRFVAFDNSHGWESVKLSFLVNRRASGRRRPCRPVYDEILRNGQAGGATLWLTSG
jgi:ribulose-bisphosphate carboxylase small chain